MAREVATEDNLTSGAARQRSHVDQQVGGLDYLLVMLDHHHGVADVSQSLQDIYQSGCVTGVQAYARLVEDVHRADQGTAQGLHQIYSLAFSAGKGVAGAVHRQVGKSHIPDAAEAQHDLIDCLLRNRSFIFSQAQILEEADEAVDIHGQQFSDALPADLHVQGFLAEPGPVTGVAGCAAGEPREHVFVLDLVPVGLDPAEEFIDADKGVRVSFHAVSVPDEVPHFLREPGIGFEDRNPIVRSGLHKLVPEPSHLLSPPAGDRPVVDALGLVRHDKVLAYTDDLAKPAADRAGAERAVERKEVLVRLAEGYPVEFEAVRIFLCHTFLPEDHLAPALAEGTVHG